MKEFQIFEASDLTSTPARGGNYEVQNFDFIARFSGSAVSSTAHVKIAPTDLVLAAFQSKYSELQKNIFTLQHLTKWQHKVIDYNSSYIALLLEQIDEDEFEQVACSFAEDIQTYPCEDLAKEIDRINSLTNIHYSAMDFCNIFSVSECEVEAALQKLEHANSTIESNSKERLE